MASAAFAPGKGKEESGDEWVVVIKVKYGDTLRRFSALVGKKLMITDYNMNKLRAKILNLFEFNQDDVMILAYTDEDNELVTLDNDDELLDAVICQRLNPLRINVHLKPRSIGGFVSSRKAESTDTSSEQTTHTHRRFPHSELNSTVKEALKPVPHPFRGVLTNISHQVLETASHTSSFVNLLLQLYNKHVSDASPSSQVPVNSPSGDGPIGSNRSQQQSTMAWSQANFGGPVPGSIEKMHPRDSHVVRGGSVYPPPLFIPENFSTNLDDVLGNTVASSAAHPCHSPELKPSLQLCKNPECMPRTFHRGVICNGCGMNPILGPRYMSNVKDDYDLCSACFSNIVNKNEYTRIDWSGYRLPKDRIQSSSTLVFNDGTKTPRAKLKSCFIRDVSIRDGMVFYPRSRFTKIWRMRNNGTIAWPFGTRLVWIDGNRLGEDSVELKIPESGFPVGEELDIAVDIVTPSLPAQYTSYWQLSSPSQHKFGEQVWVIIQVIDPQSASSPCDSPSLPNLNLPPEGSHPSNPVQIDVNADPLDSVFEADEIVLSEEPPNPGTHEASNLTLQLSSNVPLSVPPSDSSPVSEIKSSSSGENKLSASDVLTEEDQLEQSLLRELEEMGFNQIELSREILRQNSYDLEWSVEDLCSYAEWDPLLKELQEMGFHDKGLNRKLLKKNDGSIKRVVLDLLSGENAVV